MALPAPRQPRAPDGQPRAPAAAGATRRVGPRVAALKLNRGDDAPHMWRPEGVTVKYWNRYFFVLYYIHYLGYTKEEALVMWINKLNYSLRFGSTRVKHNTIECACFAERPTISL